MYTEKKVVLAADDFEKEELLELVKKIGPKVFCVKIHSLFDKFGPGIVKELQDAGAAKVWIDAKLHDIPNTVRLRAKAFADSGCNIITVHASGGVEMMKAAREGFGKGKIFAVTALTSLSDKDINNIYQSANAKDLVSRLAPLVVEAGMDGLVCSVAELELLHLNSSYSGLEFMVPGIRSAGVETGDQKRFDTPSNALKLGATYLVVGRQLTKVPDVLSALDSLELEISQVLS